MEVLKRRLEELKPQDVLDVGTGAGNFIYRLNEVYETSYIGIDSSKKAVDAAKEHFKLVDNISFRLMDATDMDFPDESFDLVCLSNTLHHLDDKEIIFGEMLRVLKPGGHILINEMQADNLKPMQVSHKLIHHFAAKIDRLMGQVHHETFTREEILEELEKWGRVELLDEEIELKKEMTAEEFEWYQRLIKRVVDRAKLLEEYPELEKESKALIRYVENNGYDNATSVTALIKK